MVSTERRQTPEKSEQELYNVSNIDAFIANERRHDQLDRLREVQAQSRTWHTTIIFCVLLNMIFIILAIIGWATHGFY